MMAKLKSFAIRYGIAFALGAGAGMYGPELVKAGLKFALSYVGG